MSRGLCGVRPLAAVQMTVTVKLKMLWTDLMKFNCMNIRLFYRPAVTWKYKKMRAKKDLKWKIFKFMIWTIGSSQHCFLEVQGCISALSRVLSKYIIFEIGGLNLSHYIMYCYTYILKGWHCLHETAEHIQMCFTEHNWNFTPGWNLILQACYMSFSIRILAL